MCEPITGQEVLAALFAAFFKIVLPLCVAFRRQFPNRLHVLRLHADLYIVIDL